MSPALFHIGRTLPIAPVGALATAIVGKFGKMNQEKDGGYHYHPGWDDHEEW